MAYVISVPYNLMILVFTVGILVESSSSALNIKQTPEVRARM